MRRIKQRTTVDLSVKRDEEGSQRMATSLGQRLSGIHFGRCDGSLGTSAHSRRQDSVAWARRLEQALGATALPSVTLSRAQELHSHGDHRMYDWNVIVAEEEHDNTMREETTASGVF